MEKMLVVVFDSESKAYEGTNALSKLDREGSITVHAELLIKKNAEGKTVVLKIVDELPISTVGGTAIGSLVGLLGGPYGVIIGAASGTLVGLTGDLYRSGVSAEFVDEVSAILTPANMPLLLISARSGLLPWTSKWKRSTVWCSAQRDSMSKPTS